MTVINPKQGRIEAAELRVREGVIEHVGIVARLKASGHVCVKSYEDLDTDKLRALAVAANKYGLRMMGHAPHGIDYVAVGL